MLRGRTTPKRHEMQPCLFPDNTVLINFAVIDRLDLLSLYLGDRGRIVEAVRYEVERSSSRIPNLAAEDWGDWFGEPIRIVAENDIRAVELMRTARFGGSKSDHLQHLGESQTIHVVSQDPGFQGSLILTDDKDAYRFASMRGILVRHTVEILRDLVGFQEITSQQAFELTVAIRDSPYDRTLLNLPTSARDF